MIIDNMTDYLDYRTEISHCLPVCEIVLNWSQVENCLHQIARKQTKKEVKEMPEVQSQV